MKFIDAHAHLAKNAVGVEKFIESGEFEQIWFMDLTPLGAICGYDLATGEDLLTLTKRYPENVKAFGFLDLDRGTPADVRKLRDLGFSGIKVYKPLKPYGSMDYFPLFAEAEKQQLPILFHCGLIAKGPRFSGKIVRGYGDENARPVHLTGIAEAFPDLQIIQGHVGWPWMEETEQNLYYYKNISCDVSGYIRSFDRMKEMLDRKANDGGAPGTYFNHKIHFATDEFYGAPGTFEHAVKLKHFWELFFEIVGGTYYRWGNPAEREKFFYDNAKKIFGE